MNVNEIVQNIKTKLFCHRGKHAWEHYTWGSAPVDNLNGTFGIWGIPMRECKTCSKLEMRLKGVYVEDKKKLTIKDLGYESLEDVPE